MIGIIGAMQIEVEGLIAAMTDAQSETVGTVKYTKGIIGGTEVVAAVCGIGKVYAAICAQTMILKYSPSLIINTGVAGSLSPELNTGDVAVASAVVQHDMDTTPIGEPPGFISVIEEVEIKSDKEASGRLISELEKLGVKCVSGTIASGDQFIADSAKKKRIVSLFGAVACEMEGASIGQVCRVNNVPFCVIRAISDSADGGAPEDFPKFARESAQISIAVLKAFLNKSKD